MPHVNEMFPSPYIRASDLGGQQPVVTIDRVAMEPVGQDRQMKPVLYFEGKSKGMVLNKTNSKKIAEIVGSADTDNWSGVQIKLYATEVEFQGETMEGIRVRSPLAKEATRPRVLPQTVPDDDVPFMWVLPLLLPALLAAHTVLS